MTSPLRCWDASPSWPSADAADALTPDAVGPTPDAFLERLGGPAVLRIPGRDRRRARALVTLLHGNEPSGFRALHAWLRQGERPAVDLVCFLGAVGAARVPPGFAHRMLPGRRDLNRCFREPFDGPEGALARAALRLLRAPGPELVVDLHNNTGHNPAYGVGTVVDAARLRLTGIFTSRFVHTDLRLGTLTEATDDVPSVTIECGRAGDPAADACARAGLERYCALDRLDALPARAMTIYEDAIRVCVRPGMRLAFGSGPAEGADLTLAGNLDRHNFETLLPGVPVGWVGRRGLWPLEARDARNEDVSRDLFQLRDGLIETRRAAVPIMMTTDPRAALADCIGYVVRERRHAG